PAEKVEWPLGHGAGDGAGVADCRVLDAVPYGIVESMDAQDGPAWIEMIGQRREGGDAAANLVHADQWRKPGAGREHDRSRRGCACPPPQQPRQSGDGGLAEQGGPRQLCPQLAANGGDEAHRQQRVAACREKVLLYVVTTAGERLRPDAGEVA